jgi:aminopeptidase N
MFDMVRDIKLSGVEFCEIAISFLPEEEDSILANYIFELAETVLYKYIPQGSEKETLASRILSILLTKISSASTQEIAMIYQKRVNPFIYAPDDIRKCIEWVQNDSTGIDNFTLGQLDRWEIIKRYASIESNAAKIVERELERDKSDVGELARLYCEAAYPVAETKEQCWRIYLESAETYSRYQREASMSGFNIPSQGELLAGYSDEYFSNVLRIIGSKEKEYSKDFCTHLVPRYAEEEKVIPKLEELIPLLPLDRFEIIRSYQETGQA